jgi:SAM-dependent methyltransferase
MNFDELRNIKKSHAADGLKLFSSILPTASEVLDIGAGVNEIHTNILKNLNFKVDTCDFYETATYIGDFNSILFNKQYDGVWVSHCLEHQLNVNNFLKKINSIIKEGGIVCITVPPLKTKIVGGHVNLWCPGLLIYNLVLAGFDCNQIKLKTYGYNISAIVKKKSFILPELTYDTKDLNILKNYFPENLEWDDKKQKFSGIIDELNWNIN